MTHHLLHVEIIIDEVNGATSLIEVTDLQLADQ
jgi:hypothetical protein